MILGVTPVRAGSKGLPGKNIKLLAGKPLLVWTIEAALGARMIDRYVVSTESAALADVAAKCGVEVQSRPAHLARDEATTFDVLQDLLTQIPADLIVLLQATSPIRKGNLVDDCIERFLASGADSLATGWNCRYTAYGSGGEANRQDRKGFFYDDGNIYIFKAENVRKGMPFGAKHELVYLDKEQNVDIDDEFDFWIAEQVLLKLHGA